MPNDEQRLKSMEAQLKVLQAVVASQTEFRAIEIAKAVRETVAEVGQQRAQPVTPQVPKTTLKRGRRFLRGLLVTAVKDASYELSDEDGTSVALVAVSSYFFFLLFWCFLFLQYIYTRYIYSSAARQGPVLCEKVAAKLHSSRETMGRFVQVCPGVEDHELISMLKDVLRCLRKEARRKKNSSAAAVAKRKERNILANNRARFARRLLVGFRNARVELELSPADFDKGSAVLVPSYMPEIRSVVPADGRSPYYEHRSLKWWSSGLKDVFSRARAYMDSYPTQHKIVEAEESSEIFVRPPAGAPTWTVDPGYLNGDDDDMGMDGRKDADGKDEADGEAGE
jgi:hypothetical protein